MNPRCETLLKNMLIMPIDEIWIDKDDKSREDSEPCENDWLNF